MGNFIKQTSLPQSEEFSQGGNEYPAVFPFNNDQVQLFCEQYQLTAREVADMHALFCSIDVEFLGFITIEGFLKLLRETESSIVYPYLKGIFKLVDKKEQGRVDFFEW